jgi:predicted pyridoxine 5'-phosphate oxidase superfamily flavin-nucleotide-binding protein
MNIMAITFQQTLITSGVRRAQEHYYGGSAKATPTAHRDELTAEETEFIAGRESFYMATVTEDGWPYIQHRGGPKGFLRVLGQNQLGFADFKGNRQMLSTGNLNGNDRVCLFLMDYPRRERLKIIGRAEVLDAREHPGLADQLSPTKELRGRVERLFLIDVLGFDWNCSQYITPRYTVEEIEELISPLKQRIAELEHQLKQPKNDF